VVPCLGIPAGFDRIFRLRPVHRSNAWKTQRQRNIMCCLFFTRYPHNHWSKDQTTPTEIAEITQAIRCGIGRQCQNTLGLGNRLLAADLPRSGAHCKAPRISAFSDARGWRWSTTWSPGKRICLMATLPENGCWIILKLPKLSDSR
jgi:hypothetical protein